MEGFNRTSHSRPIHDQHTGVESSVQTGTTRNDGVKTGDTIGIIKAAKHSSLKTAPCLSEQHPELGPVPVHIDHSYELNAKKQDWRIREHEDGTWSKIVLAALQCCVLIELDQAVQGSLRRRSPCRVQHS